MRDSWIENAVWLSHRPADLWCGGRKILRGRQVEIPSVERGGILLEDAGYTNAKMTALTKAYFVKDSVDAALELWRDRVQKRKYGSVSFHCYNHLVKGHAGSSRIASNMGPCIQAVSLTWLGKEQVAVDAFYRTTEFFKKFPADLVFLQTVLLYFNLPPETVLTCHFANLTLHPMYWITLVPHMPDPLHELERLRNRDELFWRWVVKWTYKYLCDDTGIRKYAQAQRVQATSADAIDAVQIRRLRGYLRTHMRRM